MDLALPGTGTGTAPPPALATADDAHAAWLAQARRARWRRRLLPIAGAAALLLLWWGLIVGLEVKPFIAPSPVVVVQTLVAKWDVLLANLWPTAVEAVLGFALGTASAMVVATVFVHRKTVEEAFFPIVVLLNSIPVVAKAPILLLLLGDGMAPKIAIAALVSFFPTLVNAVRGLESVSPQSMELMHVLSATRREVFFKLRLRSALPFLFSALRIASSTAVIGAIVGEWIGSQVGIGALIVQATYNFDSALLYATIICGSALSIGFFLVVAWLERLTLRGLPTAQAH